MLRRRSIFVFFLCTLHCCQAAAVVNLALHKSYTISPKPNYRLCSDEEDKLQLTDGKTYGSNWTRKSTVGWRIKGANPEITIDLGSVLPVGEVRVHSIGGGLADVEFPEFIAVLVSNDGKSFKFAGFIDSMDLVRGGSKKNAHTFSIKKLNTEGQFVKVVMQTGGVYLFLDEIEVIGPNKYSKDYKASMRKLPVIRHRSQLLGAVEETLRLRAMTIATIKFIDKHKNALGDEYSKKTYQELKAIAEKLSELGGVVFSVEQMALVDRNLGAVRARAYRKIYNKLYVCLPCDPMKVLYEKQMVSTDKTSKKEIELRLWQGEYESAAINIINCSDVEIRVVGSVSPLTDSDGEVISSGKVFTIRRAVFVKARKLGSIGDALVLQGERSFSLMPGQTVQIWLTFHARQLNAGQYKASFTVVPMSDDLNKLPIEQLPVRINVEPVMFPQSTALNACTWAYPRVAPITKKTMSETADDLESHYNIIFVVHPGNLAWPVRVPLLGNISRMNFAKTNELIRINDYAKTYLFWLAYTHDDKDYGRFGDWMSLSWKKAFSSWLFQLTENLKKQGIGYDRFALYPFDESLCQEFYELAKFIKSVDSRIRIYANSFGKGPSDIERFRNLVDIWCLHQDQCFAHQSWLAKVKSFGKKVWMYSEKGPGKANHPYSYYRLMPWRAFKLGLDGAGFWVYTDPVKADSWNDTGKAIGYYGVVYGARESLVNTFGENIIPSRRWEAWREGVEDYQYLYELQRAIETIRGKSDGKALQAQRLLDSQVNYVLERPYDTQAAYRARRYITDRLRQLKNILN